MSIVDLILLQFVSILSLGTKKTPLAGRLHGVGEGSEHVDEQHGHEGGDDAVDGHRDDGLLDNRAFLVLHIEYRADGDDVVAVP